MCVIKGMKVTNPGIKLSYLTEICQTRCYKLCLLIKVLSLNQLDCSAAHVHIYDFPSLDTVFCLFSTDHVTNPWGPSVNKDLIIEKTVFFSSLKPRIMFRTYFSLLCRIIFYDGK